jgi:flagellin
MDTEYQQLMSEMARIANTTKWSNFSILNGQGPDGSGSEFQFKVGSDNSQNDMRFSSIAESNVADGAKTSLSVTGVGKLTSGNVFSLSIPVTGQTSPLTIDVAVPVDTTKFAAAIQTAIENAATARNISSGFPSTVSLDSNDLLTFSYSGAQPETGTLTVTSAPNSIITVAFRNFDPFSPGSVTSPIGGSNLNTSAAANSALSAIDKAIDEVNTERSTMGAKINRLQFSVNNSTNIVTHLSESRSRIEDVDYAKATSELARRQIIQQAATAMLAQANQSPQTVLQLLKQG